MSKRKHHVLIPSRKLAEWLDGQPDLGGTWMAIPCSHRRWISPVRTKSLPRHCENMKNIIIFTAQARPIKCRRGPEFSRPRRSDRHRESTEGENHPGCLERLRHRVAAERRQGHGRGGTSHGSGVDRCPGHELTSTKVREILGHTLPLPSEASSPIRHFDRNANAIMSTLNYVDGHLGRAGFYASVYERHLANLRRMALASLVESFERFLKELAILCIDSLVSFVNDDRFDEFSAKGGQIAFHLAAGSVGKALCESDTWVTNRTTNDRFKKLLKLPFGDNWESLFPDENQPPPGERDRARTLSILWQVRHTITHNVGVITGSDAGKFKMLVKANVESSRISEPRKSRHHLRQAFLVRDRSVGQC